MKIIIFLVLTIATYATLVFANPTQTGVTGLLNVPTADTLDSGNICVGIWGNISKSSNQNSIILPATLTMGIGSFWEAYATYPNLLFNGQEDVSGRGTADAGTKIRFLGKRDSNLKLAADIFVNRHVSEDLALDGILDVGGRLIASVKTDRIGIHLYGGYLNSGDKTVSDNELLYGGGLEYMASPRTKVTFEIFGKSAANPFSNSVSNYPVEGSLGLQYYISPHLTLNLAGGIGLTSASPDWRTLIGFSTCQGIGTYIKTVPTLASEGDDKGKKRETIKPVKIIPLTSLIKTTAPIVAASKIEVPVEPDKEEIVIKPYGQIIIPSQPVTSPVVLPLLPQEIKMTRIESEVSVQPKTEIVTDVIPADESGLEGVTPLYGIEVMGDTVEISTAKPAQLPEKMTVYRKFRFPDVMFEFNQAELSNEVKKALSEVAEQTRNDKKWTYLRIDGHTDSLGSVNYNMDLSIKRAIAVASYLILQEGVDPTHVFVKGMGKSKLIADNVTTEGRRMNRRFEILFLVPKGK
jgi:outer membrane protein OmpA-like peptidoglycan-associated protein